MPRDGRYDDLTALLDARGDALLRTAVLLTPGREAGQDLLQEALERLLRKWHKVHGDPEGYLRRIMYNRAVDGWRLRARRPEVLGLPAEVRFRFRKPKDLLKRALERLAPNVHATFVLHRRDGMTLEEIAQQLGVSRPMVKKYLMKALLQFRHRLEAAE